MSKEKYSSDEPQLQKVSCLSIGQQVQDFFSFLHYPEDYVKKKDLVTCIARSALLFGELYYEIEHRPGQRIQHIDSLNAHPLMIIGNDTLTASLKKEQLKAERTSRTFYEERYSSQICRC